MDANGHYAGMKDGLTEYETLIGLARVINSKIPEPLVTEKKTIQGNASEFKKCKNGGGGYFPFNDQTMMDAFDQMVKCDYELVLQRMVAFVDKYLEIGGDAKKDEVLVKALIELIALDGEIADSQKFYVKPDGTAMTKDEIVKADTFCYQSFLLGVYHFAVTVVKDNTVGAAAFNEWCPSGKGGRRTYTGTVGKNWRGSISLTYKEKVKKLNEEDIEIVEPGQQEESYEEARKDKNPDVAPKMFCFNITGNGNNFYNQVDTVNNYYGGEKDGE